MNRLDGKAAIITGGASGIGRATALLFANEGARVTIADIDESGGQETVAAIVAAGGQAELVAADLGNAADCDRVVGRALSRWSAVHVLHNNAYWAPTGRTVLNTSEEEWDRTQAVTLKSMYLLARRAIPAMIDAGGGSIVNMASVSGMVGSRAFAAYAAAKGGVIALTKAMAQDFGKQGVRVNCISPGPIDTPATAQLQRDPGWLEFQVNRLLVGRLGRPEDVAYAVLYLASDESSFVTGTNLVVDGGATSR
jgi:NAD(P)-dependent dehydrogenase (short-subunit alcohol dehydrogenase family)